MPQKPRRKLGWPCRGWLRGVHAFPHRNSIRPLLAKMRRVRMPPELPPPANAAAFSTAILLLTGASHADDLEILRPVSAKRAKLEEETPDEVQ